MAAEACLDFDAPFISHAKGLKMFFGGLFFFACVFGGASLTNPEGQRMAVTNVLIDYEFAISISISFIYVFEVMSIEINIMFPFPFFSFLFSCLIDPIRSQVKRNTPGCELPFSGAHLALGRDPESIPGDTADEE